jgi:hypothetical protein
LAHRSSLNGVFSTQIPRVFHLFSTRNPRTCGILVRMNNTLSIPSADELRNRITTCRAELAALRRLLRLAEAVAAAEKATAQCGAPPANCGSTRGQAILRPQPKRMRKDRHGQPTSSTQEAHHAE